MNLIQEAEQYIETSRITPQSMSMAKARTLLNGLISHITELEQRLADTTGLSDRIAELETKIRDNHSQADYRQLAEAVIEEHADRGGSDCNCLHGCACECNCPACQTARRVLS